ncbi:hypothetical protein M0R45_011360 [Rubus argutus]|uniref:non-specific serine/threonine protein kinase n=1 Tax=Rubus argutus TaxID=59490 RepID=A0AAW1YCS9_RUBAR
MLIIISILSAALIVSAAVYAVLLLAFRSKPSASQSNSLLHCKPTQTISILLIYSDRWTWVDGFWFSFSVKFGFQGFICVNLEDGLARFPLDSEGVSRGGWGGGFSFGNLSSRQLSGNIAASFSNLRSIQSLDLSHNELTGPIPEFLAQPPSLTVPKVFSCAIPKALMEKHNSGALTLNLDGNPEICVMDSCKGKKWKVVPNVASSVSVAILVLLCALAIFWIHKRKRQGTKIQSKAKNWRLTYFEIVNITSNFTSVPGEGGFGRVYHGILKDTIQVAVKVLSSSYRQGSEEFQNEVVLLLGIHHKTVHLLADASTNVLTWKGRLLIAVDAARGLDYLHNCCQPPIVHRDLKTSNILLNEDMQAKIGDCGLCKVFTTENETHVSTDAKGTPGYVDPEYYSTGKLNRKSNVYSFGVGLLELMTGLPAIVKGPPPLELCEWVGPYVERKEIENIIDPRLQSYNINSAWRAIEVAMACLPSLAVHLCV